VRRAQQAVQWTGPDPAAVAPYETSASFPSGHALNATVAAGVVAYPLVVEQRRMSARVLTLGAAVVFAVLMGLSRVFLGHHWLTDVLMAWTPALAWLVMIIVAHRLSRTIRNVRRRSTRPATGRPPDSAS
jgi:undecaprenyl-diphosphatase